MAIHPRILVTASLRQWFVTTLPPPQLISLSEKSLLIHPAKILGVGQTVLVTIRFVDSDQETEVLTEVAWTNPDMAHMALRILEVDDDGLNTIRHYCAQRIGRS